MLSNNVDALPLRLVYELPERSKLSEGGIKFDYHSFSELI